MSDIDDPFQRSVQMWFQHGLAELGRADNQCTECMAYRADGKPPTLHKSTCESSGQAERYRKLHEAWSPPWVPLCEYPDGGRLYWAPPGTVPDYGPGYALGDVDEGDDS